MMIAMSFLHVEHFHVRSLEMHDRGVLWKRKNCLREHNIKVLTLYIPETAPGMLYFQLAAPLARRFKGFAVDQKPWH